MCWETGQVRIWYNNKNKIYKNKIYKKIQNIYNHCTDRPQWSWSNKIISVFFFDLTNYSFWSFEKRKTKGRYWKGIMKSMSLTIVLKRMFVIKDRLKAIFQKWSFRYFFTFNKAIIAIFTPRSVFCLSWCSN